MKSTSKILIVAPCLCFFRIIILSLYPMYIYIYTYILFLPLFILFSYDKLYSSIVLYAFLSDVNLEVNLDYLKI